MIDVVTLLKRSATMNLPGCTAGASLRKTSGHYGTGGRAINLRTQMISAVEPAVPRNVCSDLLKQAHFHLSYALSWNREGDVALQDGDFAGARKDYAISNAWLAAYYDDVELYDNWGC
jgi:hypothetical protein